MQSRNVSVNMVAHEASVSSPNPSAHSENGVIGNSQIRTKTLELALPSLNFHQSINQFSGPAYPWGVAGAAAQVGASKHLDPLQQRTDALLGCQGETN